MLGSIEQWQRLKDKECQYNKAYAIYSQVFEDVDRRMFGAELDRFASIGCIRERKSKRLLAFSAVSWLQMMHCDQCVHVLVAGPSVTLDEAKRSCILAELMHRFAFERFQLVNGQHADTTLASSVCSNGLEFESDRVCCCCCCCGAGTIVVHRCERRHRLVFASLANALGGYLFMCNNFGDAFAPHFDARLADPFLESMLVKLAPVLGKREWRGGISVAYEQGEGKLSDAVAQRYAASMKPNERNRRALECFRRHTADVEGYARGDYFCCVGEFHFKVASKL
jgi:hypothetical protein